MNKKLYCACIQVGQYSPGPILHIYSHRNRGLYLLSSLGYMIQNEAWITTVFMSMWLLLRRYQAIKKTHQLSNMKDQKMQFRYWVTSVVYIWKSGTSLFDYHWYENSENSSLWTNLKLQAICKDIFFKVRVNNIP